MTETRHLLREPAEAPGFVPIEDPTIPPTSVVLETIDEAKVKLMTAIAAERKHREEAFMEGVRILSQQYRVQITICERTHIRGGQKQFDYQWDCEALD